MSKRTRTTIIEKTPAMAVSTIAQQTNKRNGESLELQQKEYTK